MNLLQNYAPNRIGFSVDQLTKIIPLGRTSIYKLLRDGRLKSVIICGRRIIPANEVDALLKSCHSISTLGNLTKE